MSPHSKPVFSTSSPRRWYAVKWVILSAIGIVILGFSCLVLTYSNSFKPELPKNYNGLGIQLSQIAKDSNISWRENAETPCCTTEHPTCLGPLSNNTVVPMAQQIRAAFCVSWDPQSYYSLASNIEKINTVLPEWFFLNGSDTLTLNIDERTYSLLQKHPSVHVIPTLTNYWNGHWNSQNVKYLLTTPKHRDRIIDNIIHIVKKYGFEGINIDFQDLSSDFAVNYHDFMAELHKQLNTEGLMLTQSYIPFNNPFSLKKLSPTTDLVFVMAFNQHYQTGKVSSTADQKWIEEVIIPISKIVPVEKLVLGISGYGLNWGKKGIDADDISYRGALSIAQEAAAHIKFNSSTYNLEFEYTDDENVPHKVFFADAATHFNQMRTASNSGWRGVALWHIGAEDPRVWQFFNKDLSTEELKKGYFDINSLQKNITSQDVDYIGQGEVTDIMTVPTDGEIKFTYDSTYRLITNELYEKLPTSYVVQRFGKVADKKLVLTFDDGPDEKYTGRILDILKKERAPAAFFLIGSNIAKNPDLAKRIFAEGHEIGNHTYSHPKLDHIASWRAGLELIRTRRAIESLTGHSTILFRPPYNQYQEPENVEQLASLLLARQHNYLTVNESIDAQDWRVGSTADSIINRIEKEMAHDRGHIILLHDAGGNREATVNALPIIIKYFKNKGYQFTSLADLMGRSKNDLMPQVYANQKMMVKMNGVLSGILNSAQESMYWIFYLAIILSIFRSVFILFFAYLQRKKQKKDPFTDFAPPLSIIVPAYNEEVNAVSTVMSLLQQNYKEYEIVFVDDGSKDDTYQRINSAFSGHPRVQVWTKPNGGKASALNFGLVKCRHDYVVCIDADTQLSPNALREIAKPFKNPNVGAVAGNVRVGNQINWLTKWQSIEYTTAQNFDRMAFAYLNCITVVPGAIGAFRKSAIVEELNNNVTEKESSNLIGKYEMDTLAEDCDLTVQILKKGYIIAQNNDAIAITESPETINQFLKQRFRWTFGVMQVFWKNREVFLRTKYKALGFVAFPNMLIYQFLLPIFSPIADLILIGSLISWAISDPIAVGDITFWEKYHPFILYSIFLFFDLLCAGVALRYENMSLKNLWMIIPQRFAYRPLMYSVLYKSFMKAAKGEIQGWGSLKRTGNMEQITNEKAENIHFEDKSNNKPSMPNKLKKSKKYSTPAKSQATIKEVAL